MLRRFAAIIFVLALAGQIYAGVCGCMGGENETAHACCKPKTAIENSMQGKTCCETACAMSHSENIVPDRLETLAKITFHAVKPAAATSFTLEAPSIVHQNVALPRAVRDAVSLRPPELYLRHHAFRI